MVLVDKRQALQEIDNVPVACDLCRHRTELQAPSDAARDSLIEASYIRSFLEEIALLYRTKAFFERFPYSRHPIKIAHLSVEKSERDHVHADNEFSDALTVDGELSEFLTNHGFLLFERLSAISEAHERWQERLDTKPIQCEACSHGHHLIERSLFDRLLNGSDYLARHPK